MATHTHTESKEEALVALIVDGLLRARNLHPAGIVDRRKRSRNSRTWPPAGFRRFNGPPQEQRFPARNLAHSESGVRVLVDEALRRDQARMLANFTTEQALLICDGLVFDVAGHAHPERIAAVSAEQVLYEISDDLNLPQGSGL